MPRVAYDNGTGLSAPDAILFDWDNTLVDSWDCIREATNRTLMAFGQRPWSLDEVKDRLGLSLRDTFPDLFGARWEEARDVFVRTFEAIHFDYLQPLPGAERLLETLNAKNIPLAVISNKNGDFLRSEADRLGWCHFFDCLIGANDATQDKPALPAVNQAMKALKRQAGPNAWFVGDAAVDMECAHNAGCLPVLLRVDAPRPGEFADSPFRIHLPDCHALSRLVCELSVPISPI